MAGTGRGVCLNDRNDGCWGRHEEWGKKKGILFKYTYKIWNPYQMNVMFHHKKSWQVNKTRWGVELEANVCVCVCPDWVLL